MTREVKKALKNIKHFEYFDEVKVEEETWNEEGINNLVIKHVEYFDEVKILSRTCCWSSLCSRNRILNETLKLSETKEHRMIGIERLWMRKASMDQV